MAITITDVAFYGIEPKEPLQNNNRQVMYFKNTAAATDLVYDFYDATGAFRTALAAYDTANDTNFDERLQGVINHGRNFAGIFSSNLQNMGVAAAAASGVVAIEFTSEMPKITYNTASGPTAPQWSLSIDLKQGISLQ